MICPQSLFLFEWMIDGRKFPKIQNVNDAFFSSRKLRKKVKEHICQVPKLAFSNEDINQQLRRNPWLSIINVSLRRIHNWQVLLFGKLWGLWCCHWMVLVYFYFFASCALLNPLTHTCWRIRQKDILGFFKAEGVFQESWIYPTLATIQGRAGMSSKSCSLWLRS